MPAGAKDAATVAANRYPWACPCCRGKFVHADPPSYAVQGAIGYRLACSSCGLRWSMPYAPLYRAMRSVGRIG